MKRFVSTKFFRTLEENTQNGTATNAKVLKKEYEKFAILLFAEGGAICNDRTALHNALVYAQIELSALTEGEKNG